MELTLLQRSVPSQPPFAHRPHPRGEASTVFVTIEDVQCVLWPRVFARCSQALRGAVLLVTGTVARWDRTTTDLPPILVPVVK